MPPTKRAARRKTAESYQHPEADSPMRDYEDSVWDHLAGTVSAPFAAGEHAQVAVKMIDQRGNELLVVKGLKEAEK